MIASIDPRIAALAPDFRAMSIVVEAGAPPVEAVAEKALEVAYRAVGQDEPGWARDHLAAWAAVFQKFGAKPQRTPCSAEALRKRFLRDGHGTVAEAMAAPGFARLIRAMMDQEVTPELPQIPGFDLTGYKDLLISRFRNPALRHRTAQIAMDGSQKLPQRLLELLAAPLRPMSQDDPKVRAAIGGYYADFAAVPLNNLLDQVQPQASTAGLR